MTRPDNNNHVHIFKIEIEQMLMCYPVCFVALKLPKQTQQRNNSDPELSFSTVYMCICYFRCYWSVKCHTVVSGKSRATPVMQL